MKIVTLADISLVSSTVPANEYNGSAVTLWTAGTYALGAIVYYTGTTPHHVYESIASSNTAVPGTDVTKWTDLGATDRWRMFDEFMNTQTEDSSDITVVISANQCDYVGLFNCAATTVTFALTDDGSPVDSTTIDMDSSAPTDYDEWFFSPAEYRDRVTWEFPYLASSTARLSITISNTLSNPTCGVAAIGSAYEIGGTLYDPEIGFDDYSYKYENETTGAVYMIQGNYRDAGSLKVWFGNEILDAVKRRMVANRGKVAIYDFNNEGTDYESLIFYGFPSKFRMSIPGPTFSRATFTMQGMI